MKTLPAGTVKRIHVDRRVIAQNRKTGGRAPALTIQTSKGPIKAWWIDIRGPIIFNQKAKQLKCGARIYGHTYAEVRYM